MPPLISLLMESPTTRIFDLSFSGICFRQASKKAGSGFGTDTNIITMITKDGDEEMELMSKFDAANIILTKLRSLSE